MGIKKNESHLKMFSEYQVNKKLMSKTNKKTLFMHCLPAHRGCEVTNEVIDGDNSLVWDEAQNRLYAHQSIFVVVFKKSKFIFSIILEKIKSAKETI